ncbi:hypothetical protein [Mycobacteroides abscessus]|uniref:hypothetical protein n=1 Tax=Mycobacteroides abscessus TaxID=36809 RepID=UPI0010423DF2|nr:hypothetical protein [Mycobacteroides abscessus]MBN7333072.1 hypothetical protein [Mycobacteroides abscessus subsp. abscessus]
MTDRDVTPQAAATERWSRVLQRSGISRLRPGIVTGEQVRMELLSILDRDGPSDTSRSDQEETAVWRRRVEDAPEHDLWFWFVMWPIQQDKNEMYAEWIRAHPPAPFPNPAFKTRTDDMNVPERSGRKRPIEAISGEEIRNRREAWLPLFVGKTTAEIQGQYPFRDMTTHPSVEVWLWTVAHPALGIGCGDDGRWGFENGPYEVPAELGDLVAQWRREFWRSR